MALAAPPDEQAVSTPFFEIKLNGNDLPPEARGEVTRLVVEECLDAAGSFEMQLSNWDMDRQAVSWSDADLFDPGASVEIRLGYVESTETVLTGEVTGLELSFPDGARSLVTVRGYDRLHRFRRGKRTRSYLQVKDSEIASKLAADLGLTADVEDSGAVHEHLVQVNQSDLDFLFSRARASGFELLVDDKTLHFRKLRHDRGTALTLDFTHGLMMFDGYLSTSDQVGQVTVHGTDPATLEPIVGLAQAGDVAATMGGSSSGPAASARLFGERTLSIVDQPVVTQAEADQLALSIMQELALGYISGEATAQGNPAIRVGTVVELAGLGRRFSGNYYVTRVRHVWDGQFLTRFGVRRNAS